MIKRALAPRLLESLRDTPVVFLSGARQSGKSTLAQGLAAGPYPARYLTMDDAAVLSAARGDPEAFLEGLKGPTVLDEVQFAPDLFPALKANIDRDRRPGRFLLTGSANILLLPRLASSLVGRMEVLTLAPLAQAELSGGTGLFPDALFAGRPLPPVSKSIEKGEVTGMVLTGGYPEVVARSSKGRREAWFGAYLTTLLQRDVRELSNIEGLGEMPRLLSLLASRAGQMVNYADLGRSIAIPQSTLKRYLGLLQGTFLVHALPAWSVNLGARAFKTPKLYVNDTGLMAYLLGVDQARLAADAGLFGTLLENFVVMEVLKQCSWSRTRPAVYYYRAQTGVEVDLVLERRDGRVAAIEIKSSRTLDARDARGLRFLQERLKEKFVRGVILYFGDESVAFGRDIHAVPIQALWE
jgi:predicted AAA+ superfamily ATPase